MDRRSAMRRVAGALGTMKLWNESADAAPASSSGAYRVESSKLTVNLDGQGEITGVILSPERGEKVASKVTGRTVLAGCTPRSVTARKLVGGGVEFTKVLTHEREGHSCRLTERFEPTNSGSIRWELEILGDGASWSTPIETHLAWPVTAGTRFWTTWGDSRPAQSPGWNDPLVPVAFGVRALHYGYGGTRVTPPFSVSIATILESTNDTGLSLALSPEDAVVELDLLTTPQGGLVFSRSNRRIGRDRPVHFAMDLVAHPADWRAGLGWMVARYLPYFDPPCPLAHEVGGNAAYAQYEGDELDAYKFFAMGFRFNWKASFDWYAMGMSLPPVGDDVEYLCYRRNSGTPEFPTSISRLREYSERMRRCGFYVLNYFNTFIFGYGIKFTPPPPARRAKNDEDLWRDPNDMAFYVFPDALWHDPSGKLLVDGGTQASVLMDPGVPTYQKLLLDQGRRFVEKFPASPGICIDEMGYLGMYNLQRDDGVTWRDGRPAATFVNSCKDLLSKLGPVFHEAGKVVYGNPGRGRLDAMRHLDGFYDEGGYDTYNINGHSFIALRKPYTAWTGTIDDPEPDAFFQRHLHMGAYLSVPYPLDDHAILPSGSRIDTCYTDYGPMFDALRGRTWVLEPHVIEVEGEKAKANLFAIPGGYLVVVTFGGESDHARVRLRGLHKLPSQEGFAIEAIHPGETEWAPLSGAEKGDLLTLDVPLRRGCAMVKLRYAWIKPDKHYFLQSQTVTLGTTLREAQLRYTLDGKAPGADSALYAQPLTVDRTTPLKVAAFRDGSLLGSVLSAEMVKTRPPAPWIDPFSGTFADEVTVELRLPYQFEHAEIRYALDGGDVTTLSTLYSGPIKLNTTTTIRARTFLPGLEPSVLAERQFSKMAPLPPLPDVYLSDLVPLRSSVRFQPYELKNDRSVRNTPLSIAGKNYARGVGVSPPAELIYKLEPEYGSFVAVVGIDDSRKNWYTQLVKFHVYARNEREELLLHESPMLYPGEFWPIQVRVPLACQEIRLTADWNMDEQTADWANAGFLRDVHNQGADLLRDLRK